jgi:hypothetical protein
MTDVLNGLWRRRATTSNKAALRVHPSHNQIQNSGKHY